MTIFNCKINCKFYFFALLLNSVVCLSQLDSNFILSFSFNDHLFREDNDLVKIKAVGANLVEDRFGNAESAIFLNGHVNSYLSLGTSKLLKSKVTTISLWVNLSRRIFSGKGYPSNPIFQVKNGPQEDFYSAYDLIYDGNNGRFSATTTKDSTAEAIVCGVNLVSFNEWYHLVFTSDNDFTQFYINGKSQGRAKKGFETVFLDSDSVMIGNTANKKNERYSQGVFDDIKIFHRVLSEEEIIDLYNAPNPNKPKVILMLVLKLFLVLLGIVTIAYLIIWNRRRILKRASDQLLMESKLYEMEIRTLKAQMNPHFIFNSLNSIQQFIMQKENDKAELYLSKFSKLIRELLESNTKEDLTIEEEVRIIRGYLEMESQRFGNSLNFEVNVDARIDQQNSHIPHMMIQPFIENAIWHGLLTKEDNRILKVAFETNTISTIKCIVDDNGVGREESKKRVNTFKKKSLALSFVKQRLELMSETLKEKCTVEIVDKMHENGRSAGTKVIVILPLLHK